MSKENEIMNPEDSNDDFEWYESDNDCPACGSPLHDNGGYKICTDEDCNYVDI